MNFLQWRSTLGLFALSLLCACSKTPTASLPQQNAQWLKDGMIAISRPVPSIRHSASQEMLGFMPIQAPKHSGAWVAFDTSKNTLSIMNGEKALSVISGQGFENLKPGNYSIVHKQKEALWYAPDAYFTARNLPIPAKGDRSRFRRGALGDFVLYLDKDTPIYSGPVWDAEIGGVRLEESDVAKLYSSIEVGSSVEVR
ncbi:MAG: L,D-transpeptidase [Deltaproteobacteria bacterium]|nr:L,D-transpeptidase [Deltaproteobacteria bacterium]